MITPEENLKREVVDLKPKPEVKFPGEDESDRRFDAIFSAIGNSETKCLTLLLLNKSSQTDSDLNKKFVSVSRGAWRSNVHSQGQYCRETLAPIGLVAEVGTLYYGATEYVIGYRLTEAGESFGQPIAAFLLQKSSQLPFSLRDIFGPTASSGESRPVMNRGRILQALQSGDTQRVTDIAARLGIKPNMVGEHIRHLQKLGLVEYSATYEEHLRKKGYAVYEFNNGTDLSKAEDVVTNSALGRSVVELMSELRRASVHEISPILKEKYKRKNLEGDIEKILTFLFRKGVLNRYGNFEAKKLTNVNITELGKSIVSDIIIPIQEALRGNNQLLTQWRQIDWVSLAEDAVGKYKSSRDASINPKARERIQEIISAIEQNPGIRPIELKDVLKGYHPGGILAYLLREGKIRREIKGAITQYYPSNTESEQSPSQ